MSTPVDTTEYVFLCMTANGWGSSKTSEADALKALKSYMGTQHVKRYGYVTYRVDPAFEIDEINGTIYTPKGKTPVKVTDKIVKPKPKTKSETKREPAA